MFACAKLRNSGANRYIRANTGRSTGPKTTYVMCNNHPLGLFRYCPRCGSDEFAVNDARSKRCGKCGFTYYLNASAATAAVVVNAGHELLVSTRASEPAKGTLDLPGGFVDGGENIFEGMRREIFEETGCRVREMKWLFSLANSYRFSGFDVPTADSFILAKLCEGDVPRAADDAVSLQWIEIGKLVPEKFGLYSISLAIRKIKELHYRGEL